MIILICEEFPSQSGGVSYYCDVLAKDYYNQGQLKGVIDLSHYPKVNREFNIIKVKLPYRKYGTYPFDKYVIPRKINSLIYKFYKKIYLLKNPIFKALEDLKYDPAVDTIFYTYQVHYPYLINQVNSRFNGKYWVVYYGLDLIGFQNRKEQINMISKNAEKTYLISKATQNLFNELGYKADNQELLYPKLDESSLKNQKLVNKEEIAEKYNLNLNDKILITGVCRLVKRKGIHFGIEVVKKLNNLDSNKYLYLVGGNGPEKDSLKSLINKNNLQDSIKLLGFIDDRDKYSILNLSSFFLMPNYDDGGTDFEGFGISFLEADYYDNVVIGGNHGGAVEAISQCKKGSVFSFPEEIDKAVNYIRKMASK